MYVPEAVVEHAGSGTLWHTERRIGVPWPAHLEFVYVKNTPACLLCGRCGRMSLYDAAAAVYSRWLGAIRVIPPRKLAALAGLPRRARESEGTFSRPPHCTGATARGEERDWMEIKRREKGSCRCAPPRMRTPRVRDRLRVPGLFA